MHVIPEVGAALSASGALLSDGRVDMGTGRSATRIELEGFGVDPKDTREMWREAIEHVVGCWTNERYSFEGKHWSMPKRLSSSVIWSRTSLRKAL